jgi:(p)ppGpp synthase/HD superfamily hydrolase
MSSPRRIDMVVDRSALVRGAISVARRAHAGQVRETGCGEIPFIEHPIAVAELLAEQDHPDRVLAAALLHEIAEYTENEPPNLIGRFGERVSLLVAALTEDLEIEPYEDRKEEHRLRVAAAGDEARTIFAADKVANVAVLREAYSVMGESVDLNLPVSLDLKILVWEYDLEMLFDELPGAPLVDRFAEEMIGLWGERAEEGREESLC